MTDSTIAGLSDPALDNYIESYEAGRVQRRPRLRFVDRAGRACPAAAMAGAETSADFAGGPAGRDFRGSHLEDISRAFEDGRLDADRLYRECLVELARRRSRGAARTPLPSSTLGPDGAAGGSARAPAAGPATAARE